MNEKQITAFVMERVKDDKKADAQKLLDDAMGKVADKKVDLGDMMFFAKSLPQLMGMIKAEHLDEVKKAVTDFIDKQKK